MEPRFRMFFPLFVSVNVESDDIAKQCFLSRDLIDKLGLSLRQLLRLSNSKKDNSPR